MCCFGMVVGGGVVQGQSHSNLKNTIKNQGANTRNTVRNQSTNIQNEIGAQHAITQGDIADALAALQAAIAALQGGGGGGDSNHTPSWDQSLPCPTQANCPRFVRVLPTTATPAGEGVLDKETGVVWQHTLPSAQVSENWDRARRQCLMLNEAGRKGWRLPSVHELNSLVVPDDPAGGPDLPTGHPFSNIQSHFYWSATTVVETPTDAWGVGFGNGDVLNGDKSFTAFVWCVRGGGPLSEY